MPLFARRRQPADNNPPEPQPKPKAAAPPPGEARPAPSRPGMPSRRAADATADEPPALSLEDGVAVQARLRQDLAELLKAHRQQSRVLERNQKLLEQTEQELSRHRGRTSSLESE